MNLFGESALATLLVVLYKQEPLDSRTVQCIFEFSELVSVGTRVILWDNGPSRAEFIPKSGNRISVEYVHTPENLSLSVIYNRVASSLPHDGVLVVLDQDTELSAEYFQDMAIALNVHLDIGLFLPLVRSSNSGILVSPGTRQWIKGKYWENERIGVISSKDILAVASGMVIRASLLGPEGIRFDERLNLYMIDSKFLIDYEKHFVSLVVVRCVVMHGDSSEESEAVERKLFRFRNRMRAGNIVYGESWSQWIMYQAYWVWSMIRHALHYRDARFLSP